MGFRYWGSVKGLGITKEMKSFISNWIENGGMTVKLGVGETEMCIIKDMIRKYIDDETLDFDHTLFITKSEIIDKPIPSACGIFKVNVLKKQNATLWIEYHIQVSD
uniref:Alpha 2 protein n=1 Tax=Mavingoni virus TaxID=2603829 RepID=A0A5B9BHW3_9RHAB|nr:alpha 2 protein [Mavingoni virus]